jgi:hypothetical protein
MRTKTFFIGLAVGLAPFAAANIYGYIHMGRPGWAACDDCSASFGFPFALWVEGGFVGVRRVLWGGLLADAAIATGAGVILGLTLAAVSGARRRLR